MTITSCCSKPASLVVSKSKPSIDNINVSFRFPFCFGVVAPSKLPVRVCRVRSSMVDSHESSSSDFVKRVEQAWLISQQPKPIACSSCNSKGCVECKWCGGTGFFILGDNMLCEVPSRNTGCVICSGQGSMCCSDCKGTGFRAKWLGNPRIAK